MEVKLFLGYEIKYSARGLFFTWDDVKNKEDVKKHEGITFII
jgi:hypothetical protein